MGSGWKSRLPCPIEELTERLQGGAAAIVCGEPSLLPGWQGKSLAQPWTPPEGLARIAARRLAAGDTDDPLGLVPLYVVPPSISTPKPKAVAGSPFLLTGKGAGGLGSSGGPHG